MTFSATRSCPAAPWTVQVSPSAWISAPSARQAPTQERVSAESSGFEMTLFPRASVARVSARIVCDLEAGTVTSPERTDFSAVRITVQPRLTSRFRADSTWRTSTSVSLQGP